MVEKLFRLHRYLEKYTEMDGKMRWESEESQVRLRPLCHGPIRPAGLGARQGMVLAAAFRRLHQLLRGREELQNRSQSPKVFQWS